MKKNILKRKRVVMTTIGSLGDLHPYIALALEMRQRYVEPIIATSNAYREGLSRSISSFVRFDRQCWKLTRLSI